jgi:hypothetical protein
MDAWERRCIAEYLQVMQQLVFGWKFGLAPRVTFGRSFPANELSGHPGTNETRQRIIDYANTILAEHLLEFSH